MNLFHFKADYYFRAIILLYHLKTGMEKKEGHLHNEDSINFLPMSKG